MSTDVVYSAVHDFMSQVWTSTPLAYENDGFVPGEEAVTGNPATWILVEIAGNAYEQRTIGAGSAAANLWQEEGQVWFHIFVPMGSGSLVARRYATQLADLYKGLFLDPDIEFQDISVGLGQSGVEEGNYWRVSMSVDWVRSQ